MDLPLPDSSPLKITKPLQSSTVAAPSPSKTGISAEIETPEKHVPPPLRRTVNKNVVFSVNEVRKSSQRLHKLEESGIDHANQTECGKDFSTTEKLHPSRKIAKVEPLVKLPEKYETLAEFFDCMMSSIRLLRLKRSMTTFSKISSSVQHLTKRRFTHRHLAQLKSVFPEAIEIQKVDVYDEATCCLKPELLVFMRPEVAESKSCRGESGFTSLRKMFREKLLDFFKEHSEEDLDVLEVMLPHPFNQTISTVQSSFPQTSSQEGSTSLQPRVSNFQGQMLPISSHIPPSFRRSFSQKTPVNVEKTSLLCQWRSSVDQSCSPLKVQRFPIIECTSRAPMGEKSRSCILVPSFTSTDFRNYAEKKLNDGYVLEGLQSAIDSSPVKPDFSPPKPMTETPELQMEKRSRPSPCDTPPDYDDMLQPERKKIKRSLLHAKLSLTPKKNPKERTRGIEESSGPLFEDLSFLPDHLLHSVKNESKALASIINKQKIVAARLPKTFDLILLVFQSAKCSVMTKNELIHKIISGDLEIVDRCEVEKQLKTLQEIVPDWIWMKSTMNGDSLFCINKTSNLDEIRQKISVEYGECKPQRFF